MRAITHGVPFFLSAVITGAPFQSFVDLAKLRRIVDALIEEEGEDAPVAVFYITAKDVQETLAYLKAILEKLRTIPNQGSKTCWPNCSATPAIHRLKIRFSRISKTC